MADNVLFLGWNRAVVGSQRFDFWHCTGGASQRQEADPEPPQLGSVLARRVLRTRWVAPGDRTLVEDTRELTVWRPAAAELVLDLLVTLQATTAPVRLEADPHHSGVHVRLDSAIEHSPARYLHAGPAAALGDDAWRGGTAVMATCTLQGEPVAVALLTDPADPAPRLWSARPYGRFGVTWATTLTPGAPERHRFRLLLARGPAVTARDQAWLEQQVRAFGTPVHTSLRADPSAR